MATTLDSNKTALVAIDWQNDFCHDDGLLGVKGNPAGDAIERTIKLADQVRAAGGTVVWVQAVYEPGNTLPPALGDCYTQMFGDKADKLCAPGAWGGELVEAIEPHDGDLIQTKHTYNAFHNTTLAERLRARAVDTLIFAGTLTSVCVQASVLGAAFNGFRVVLAADCCFDDPARHQSTLNVLEIFYCPVKTGDEVAAMLGAATT